MEYQEICGKEIRITRDVTVSYYGENNQFMTLHWEEAEIAKIDNEIILPIKWIPVEIDPKLYTRIGSG